MKKDYMTEIKENNWYIKIIVINRDFINLKLKILESNEILVLTQMSKYNSRRRSIKTDSKKSIKNK